MDQDLPFQELPTITSIDHQEVDRERTHRTSMLHVWWARIPSVLARAAVFKSLVPQSDVDKDIPDLFAYDVSEEVLAQAQERIFAEHARRLAEESGEAISSEQVASDSEKRPRVLDMFAGSGTIPLESGRLGAKSFALDLNPMAYLIELCRLSYPQRFGKPDDILRGSSPDGTWAGLPTEIEKWSQHVHERAKAEVGDLYPPIDVPHDDSDKVGQCSPKAYLWGYLLVCSNPDCQVEIPLVQDPWLAKKEGNFVALKPEFHEEKDRLRYRIVRAASQDGLGFEPEPNVYRGKVVCPVCGTHTSLLQDEVDGSCVGRQVFAVLCRDEHMGRKIIPGSRIDGSLPEEAVVLERLERLLAETDLTVPKEKIPTPRRLPAYGFERFADLFTSRQLLVLLTYAKHILRAHGLMLSQRVESERANAVATYLALILSRCVNYHSALTRWKRGLLGNATERMQLVPAWSFAERNPFVGSHTFRSEAKQVVESIELNIELSLPADVRIGTATELPFPNEHFDAIVTAAPYYEAISYAQLSDLFYVWLRRVVGHLYPGAFSSGLAPEDDEVVLSHKRGADEEGKALDDYRRNLGKAIEEAARVLKSNCYLTTYVPSAKAQVLNDFLDLAQKAGLELFDARRLQRSRPSKLEGVDRYQVLLTFRKSMIARRSSSALADAETVLALADKQEPTLFRRLVTILKGHVAKEDLEILIPKRYKGSFDSRIQEHVAEIDDPAELLRELGLPTNRRIAEKLRLTVDDPAQAVDALLKHCGFNVPEPPQEGAVATRNRLKELVSRAQLANSMEDLRGVFLTGTTELEASLKQAVWAWAGVIFVDERDNQLDQLVDNDLDRLSMGDIFHIFCHLPQEVAKTEFAARVQEMLGRGHLYRTKGIQAKLDQVVGLRNRVEHNKEGYLNLTPLDELRREMSEALLVAHDTLDRLLEYGSLPLIVRPVRLTEDVYGRRKARLKVEDGTIREIYVSGSVLLGRNHYLFPSEGNPRQIAPPMMLVSDVLEAVK